QPRPWHLRAGGGAVHSIRKAADVVALPRYSALRHRLIGASPAGCSRPTAAFSPKTGQDRGSAEEARPVPGRPAASERDGRVSASTTLKRTPLAASVLASARLSGLPGGSVRTKLNLGGRFGAMPRMMVPE